LSFDHATQSYFALHELLAGHPLESWSTPAADEEVPDESQLAERLDERRLELAAR
jgi:hypothetical protein